MKAYEHLEEIKRVLLKDGWCQGKYHNYMGQHCLKGGLELVSDRVYANGRLDISVEIQARRALEGVIIDRNLFRPPEDMPRDNINVIEFFNDEPTTTFAEIVKVLDEAILLAKEGEGR